MNLWTLLIVNLIFRREERAQRTRLLLGDRLLDAIRRRWVNE